jgi:hypothetical protein
MPLEEAGKHPEDGPAPHGSAPLLFPPGAELSAAVWAESGEMVEPDFQEHAGWHVAAGDGAQQFDGEMDVRQEVSFRVEPASYSIIT